MAIEVELWVVAVAEPVVVVVVVVVVASAVVVVGNEGIHDEIFVKSVVRVSTDTVSK
jgi:hypothetical protein